MSQALYDGGLDGTVGLMQAQAASAADFLGQIDPGVREAVPVRERLTEEVEQLHRLCPDCSSPSDVCVCNKGSAGTPFRDPKS